VLSDCVDDYLARTRPGPVSTEHPAFAEAEDAVRAGIARLLAVNGTRSVDSFHRELGHVMWEYCGMARNEAGLKKALALIPEIRDRFWKDVRVSGGNEEFNVALERAGRVADFLEFAEVLCHDALDRAESCGAHFREEFQTEDGEALRNDDEYSYVSCWEYQGVGKRPSLHKEPLAFEVVKPATRSYK
jgi:succinate dehydrogenase / fumarate reductase flavoprotein subunit